MKKIFIILIIILFAAFSQAQNEYTKWYFGANAALDFMTNPPSALNNNKMDAPIGCSSIADTSGNLLFYTNGETVWNKQHNIMANGTYTFAGIFKFNSFPIIIKQPGNLNLYYIFNAYPSPTNPIPQVVPPPIIQNGLYFSVVDMSLAGGLGSVTINNALIYTSSYYLGSSGQIHATKHANGIDYWILTHEYGNTSKFIAHLLTSTGINFIPVLSSIGLAHQGGSLGYLKFSLDGQKICTSTFYTGIELFDFNKNTGVINNPITLHANGLEKNYRGCEFSPDGTKLYVAHYFANSPSSHLIQWDLSQGISAAIISSSINIPSAALNPEALQLAPNGKIYIASNNSQSLSVINNPNALGNNCNLVIGGQPISATINNSLTSFSRFDLPKILTNKTSTPCAIQTFTNNQKICSGNLYKVGSNTYSLTGVYIDTVLNIFACNNKVRVVTQLTVSNLPNLSVSTSTLLCINDSLVFNASGASSYTWNNGSIGSQFLSPSFTTIGNFTYSVLLQGTGANGCVSASSVLVNGLVQACDVGINEFQIADFKLQIFPNPTKDVLNIEFQIADYKLQIADLKIVILNNLGQIVREEDIEFKERKATINTKDLEAGIYVLKLKMKEGMVVKKFMIER